MCPLGPSISQVVNVRTSILPANVRTRVSEWLEMTFDRNHTRSLRDQDWYAGFSAIKFHGDVLDRTLPEFIVEIWKRRRYDDSTVVLLNRNVR